MCFLPQLRALFQQLNVLREWCALYILTSKCASRHNGVQFFISHLARRLRTRRFSEPTFRPSGATNPFFSLFLFPDALSSSLLSSSLLFSSSLHFSSLLSSPLLFSSLTVSTSAFPFIHIAEVWRLNFLRSATSCYISVIYIYISPVMPCHLYHNYHLSQLYLSDILLTPPVHQMLLREVVLT